MGGGGGGPSTQPRRRGALAGSGPCTGAGPLALGRLLGVLCPPVKLAGQDVTVFSRMPLF